MVFGEGNDFCDFEDVGVVAVVDGGVEAGEENRSKDWSKGGEYGGGYVEGVGGFVGVEVEEEVGDFAEGGVLELELRILVGLLWGC